MTPPSSHPDGPKRPQRIGIVTCRAEKMADYFPTRAEPHLLPTEPNFTPDDQLLVDRLRQRGHEVTPIIWGEDVARLAPRFDCIVVRSPWDYMDSDALREDFIRWLQELGQSGAMVENEPQVMLWLMDKQYLLDFEAAGVPIIPTQLVPRGAAFDLKACCQQHAAVIVKPAVSAAGAGLEFLADAAAAERFQPEFSARCQRAAHLVQPFLPEIRTNGEWSLVYLRGQYSHGVHKVPGEGQIMVHAERGGSLRFGDPPALVREVSDRAAAAVRPAFARVHGSACRVPLYLRIDVIETEHGALLSECEGVEPELFFRARPESVPQFAGMVEEAARCAAASTGR